MQQVQILAEAIHELWGGMELFPQEMDRTEARQLVEWLNSRGWKLAEDIKEVEFDLKPASEGAIQRALGGTGF